MRLTLILAIRLALLMALCLWLYPSGMGWLPLAFFFPNCLCCGSIATIACANCSGSVAAQQYQIDISGVTSSGSSCTNCGDFNASWVVTMGVGCAGNVEVTGSFTCANGCGAPLPPAFQRAVGLQFFSLGNYIQDVFLGFTQNPPLSCKQAFEVNTHSTPPDCLAYSSTNFPTDGTNVQCNLSAATALVTAL